MTQDQIVMALLLAARSAVATTLGERAEVVWPLLESEARAAAEEAARELLVLVAAPTKPRVYVTAAELQRQEDEQVADEARKERFKTIAKIDVADLYGDKPKRLRDLAEAIEARAQEVMGAQRLTNTARRANMAASAWERAETEMAQAATLRAVASAMESGQARHLWGVGTTAHVELLDRALREARRKRYQREGGSSNLERWEERAGPIGEAEIEAVVFPYPHLYKDQAIRAAKALENVAGAKLVARRVEKLANRIGHEDYRYRVTDKDAIDDLETLANLGSKLKQTKYLVQQIKENVAAYRRVTEGMGIRSLPQLRAVLREYLDARKTKRGIDPVRKAELALVGLRIEGYVPTPNELAERMVRIAGVAPGLTVLEPSAGKGSLADAARKAGGIVSVVEQAETLRRVLSAKGHELIGNDALDVLGTYDRIVMNPPFEKGQDMVHVRRAYEANLAPGGRLVAITSEGPFFRGDKQATEFRAWLESVGGQSERLPAGSFRGSDVSTDVATRLVVIDKP